MRVPPRTGRLTGDFGLESFETQVHRLNRRENRRISGSPPGMPHPVFFPSQANSCYNAARETGRTKGMKWLEKLQRRLPDCAQIRRLVVKRDTLL